MTYARIKTDFGQLIKCTCRQFGQKFSRPPLSPLKSKPQTYAIFHFPYPRIRGPDRVTRGMSYWNYISHTSPKSKSPPTSPFANLAHNRILAALYSHQGRGRERGGVESTRLWRSPGARQGKDIIPTTTTPYSTLYIPASRVIFIRSCGNYSRVSMTWTDWKMMEKYQK